MMFESKNAGGWALALVALGLFLGLLTRDLARRQPAPAEKQAVATLVPAREERSRMLPDMATAFERVAAQYAQVIAAIHADARSSAPATFTSLATADWFGDNYWRNFHGMAAAGDPLPAAAGLGSAVVMSSDGFLLTNDHLVAGREQLTVVLQDKRRFTGTIVGRDPLTDLAVVKISAQGLKIARPGNAHDLQPGQWVVAIGNPLSQRHAVTAGIICVKGRGNAGLATFEDFIQTDAAINAYNTGGALVDLSGRLVGINTSLFARGHGFESLGVAVPINMARVVMESLVNEGRMARPSLAAVAQDLDDKLARALDLDNRNGALLAEVVAEGAAGKAGLRRGDVIVKFGDHEVQNASALSEVVTLYKPGTSVTVTVVRNGAPQRLQLVLGERQPAAPVRAGASPARVSAAADLYGLAVSALTPAAGRRLGQPASLRGVLIEAVTEDSPAAAAGLRSGDVIQEVNRQNVTSVRQLRVQLAEMAAGEAALVLVRRGQASVYFALEVPETGE